MKKILIHSLYISSILLPVVSFGAFDKIKGLLGGFKSILDLLIPMTVALAIIFFFYGIAQFVRSAGDVKTLEAGKNKMIWGVVGIFVILSLPGIIKYIGDSLGIDTNIKSVSAPSTLRGSGSSSTSGTPCYDEMGTPC
jgi:Type IV secretion system pilin